MADTTKTKTTTLRHYDWIPEWLGAPTTASEREAADDRAQEYLDEHEGNNLCIIVRRPRRGEAAGVYKREIRNGKLQILGYSIEVPEDVQALLDRAHQHALNTWPAIPPANPAIIRAVAEAMVRSDRSSRDCEVRDDASADDGSGWEHGAVGELAVHLAPSIEDGERWAESHREAILDAYAVAWRAAVEADR